MPMPPPQVTQAEAMLALLTVYQMLQRLIGRRHIGQGTRQELQRIQTVIVPLLDRQNGRH